MVSLSTKLHRDKSTSNSNRNSNIVIEYLPNVRICAVLLIWFNSENNLMNQALSFPYFGWGNAYLEKLRNLTKIPQFFFSGGPGTHVSLCFTYFSICFINKFLIYLRGGVTLVTIMVMEIELPTHIHSTPNTYQALIPWLSTKMCLRMVWNPILEMKHEDRSSTSGVGPRDSTFLTSFPVGSIQIIACHSFVWYGSHDFWTMEILL